MKRNLLFGACLSFAAVLAAAGAGLSAQVQESLPGDTAEGEILTRGPIHEAYARAVPTNPEPGLIVPDQPPDLIEEIPPDQRPDAKGAFWIPGYWGWDDDRKEFIWISGVWRVPPPGAEWVPGYWAQVREGYQWVSGYWWYREQQPQQQQGQADEVVYLSEPPQSLEVGPSSPAPDDRYFWVPGCWLWHDVRYVWRPGYWSIGVPEWVWIPAHYTWAPGGCIFVPGHWDYTIERRGLLFAPVCFDRVVYARPAFRYVPTVVINTAVLETSLFVRPRYCHYYFGDYYAPVYRDLGIVAWFSFHGHRHGCDPLFEHHYWRHRHDRTWLNRLEETYEHRVAHEEARPPRTFQAMREWVARQPDKSFRLAARLSEVDEIKKLPVRLAQVDEHERERYVRAEHEFRQFAQQRAKLEREVRDEDAHARREGGQRKRGDTAAAEKREPRRVTLPESPLAQFKSDRQQSDRTASREEGREEHARQHEAGRQLERRGLAEGTTPLERPKQDRQAQPDRKAGEPIDIAGPDRPREIAKTMPDAAGGHPDRTGQRVGRPLGKESDQPGKRPEGLTQPETPGRMETPPSAERPDLPRLPGAARPDESAQPTMPQLAVPETPRPGIATEPGGAEPRSG
ncbi:MAG: YXWGXW repeat-containing protein, partial [Pirellulales bacterium]|nr:YXWGXW repeat-containing protein [Pirellulales bacterium]